MEDEKIDGQQEEEEEETMMKMEKFYSLIRDFREARNRLIRSRNTRPTDEEEPEKKKKRKKMDGDDQQQIPSWVPSFECEDFANGEIEVEFPATPLMLTVPPCNTTGTTTSANKIVKDDASEKSLDLRLTL